MLLHLFKDIRNLSENKYDIAETLAHVYETNFLNIFYRLKKMDIDPSATNDILQEVPPTAVCF